MFVHIQQYKKINRFCLNSSLDKVTKTSELLKISFISDSFNGHDNQVSFFSHIRTAHLDIGTLNIHYSVDKGS